MSLCTKTPPESISWRTMVGYSIHCNTFLVRVYHTVSMCMYV